MKSESTLISWLPPSGLRFFIVVLLVLGIFFRFVNLDRKAYWFDETFTSLRIAGYTEAEMRQQILDGQVVSFQELKRYQLLDADRSLTDTIASIAKEEPQFPPLYFVLMRFWVQWFGNSVAVMRSLSALISLLAFPCIYWLCLELFKSPLTGWVAMALVATSPFHVVYAQEARPYSLWTVTILLSSAVLLRAIRLHTKLSWVTYAVTVVLGLYTYLYFGLVAIAHAIYVIATEGVRRSKITASYLLASLAGVLAFALWFLIVIAKRPSLHNVSGFWYNSATRQHLLNRWATNFTRVFIDFGSGFPGSFREALPLVPFMLSVLILVGYAIYFLYRQTPKRVWLFVLTLIGVQVVLLMLPDLILGRWRLSGETRYLIPCYLGFQLAVAYLLSTKITSISIKLWQQKLWQLVTVLVVSAGIVSCAMSSQAEVWWNKGFSKYDPEVADIVNKARQPLLISDDIDSPNRVISLSYLLNPKVMFQLLVPSTIPKIPTGYSEVFLYNPSPTLRSRLEKEQNYTIEPTDRERDIGLWKIAK
jgi:uncharacterized membrane protein